MKFGIPWGAQETMPRARESDTEAARGPALPRGEPFVESTAHASIVPELAVDSARTPKQLWSDSGRLGGSIARFDIDEAIAEISARRSTLDAEPPMLPLPAAVAAPDLSGLEAQLRKLTEQIETLRRPAIEEAIDALRSEFKDISRLLTERASQHAAEAFGTRAQTVSCGLERDLAELREGLRNVSPMESTGELKEAVASLARKIDLVVVQSDPVSLQRVESSIAFLREMSGQLASNDTVTKLAESIRAMAQKMEDMTHGTAAVNAGGGVAVDHLEDRIVKLMERLDASDSKFSHLEAVERGLADLLVHIDAIRADRRDRPRADRPSGTFADAARPMPPTATNHAADVATRIAASEAALGGIKPSTGVGSNERSNFIVAARRAAQAAAQEPPPRAAANAREEPKPSGRAKLTHRMKSVLVAACVIAIVIGSLQIAAKFFHFEGTTSQPHAAHDLLGRDGTGSIMPDETAEADDARTLLSQAAPSSGNIATAPAVNLTNPQSMIDAAPAAKAMPNDVTGSVPRPTVSSQPIAPAIPMLPDIADQSGARDGELPAAIGGAALRKAAIDGNPAAAYEIGLRYAEGHGVAPSLDEAAHWFERAASKGLAPAQFRLASLYEKGRGVQKDLARARALYLAAAGKGNAKAMHNLAVLYTEGVDGKPDYVTAARWFLKAASHGVADSQYNLAILYARGLGVEKSYSDSYKWFALAAAKGDHESAKKRDEIAKRLDPQALTAAALAVKAWTAEPQPAEATTVPHPPGGWDHQKASVPAADGKADTPS